MATVGLAAAGLATGLIGGILGGKSAKSQAQIAADAERAIAAENLKFQREAQAQNLALFREQQAQAFGGRKDLVLSRTGELLDAALVEPSAQIALARGFLPEAATSLAEGQQTLSAIFGGGAEADDLARLRRITTEREAAFDPIAEARLDAVGTGRQAIEQAFQDTLSRLESQRAAQGFLGGPSTFDTNRIAQSFLNARQEQARLGSAANLANVSDINRFAEERLSRELQLPEQFRNQRVQLLNAPLEQLTRQVTAQTLPEQQVAANFANVLRNATGAIPTFAPPNVAPLVNQFRPSVGIGTGQVVAAGLGGLSQGLGDLSGFFGARQQQRTQADLFNQLLSRPATGTTNTTFVTPRAPQNTRGVLASTGNTSIGEQFLLPPPDPGFNIGSQFLNF